MAPPSSTSTTASPSKSKASKVVSFGILRRSGGESNSNNSNNFHHPFNHFFRRSPSRNQGILNFSPTPINNSTTSSTTSATSGATPISTTTGIGSGSYDHSTIPSSSSTGHFHHNLLNVERGHARRESFLYKADTDRDILLSSSSCRPVSRASSVASTDPQHGDNDFIVTPFAQLLASLRNVRSNFVAISNLPPTIGDDKYRTPRRPPLHNTQLPEPAMQCAQETLEELDWCLEQLETIQIHRSVSEMASSKFRKLLNKELSHFAESSKSGVQVSKYLINTYMDNDDDERSNNDKDLVAAAAAVVAGQQNPVLPLSDPSTSGCHSPQLSLFNKAKTAAMSKISGVRRLRHSAHGIPPEYGIECAKEIAVYMQRINDWGPNIFKIHQLSKNHSLTAVTYTVLRERGLLKLFEIHPSTFVTYLLHLEHHYRDNPYHNQIHAADVAQSMHVLISSPALTVCFWWSC
jgi:cAMP-specific phosphodiesterase 4